MKAICEECSTWNKKEWDKAKNGNLQWNDAVGSKKLHTFFALSTAIFSPPLHFPASSEVPPPAARYP